MQGTIAMLMALSGLGCHHKSCAPVYAGACYASTGCYSSGYASAPMVADVVVPSCYGTASYGSCYGGGYEACYSSCYATRKHCGLFGGGLFGHKRRAAVACCDLGYTGCYGGGYSACYSMPVYGSYTPAYNVSYPSGQGAVYGSGQWAAPQGVTPMAAPAQPVAPVNPAAGATTPPPTTSPSTEAVPANPTPPANPAPGGAAPSGDAPANPAPGGAGSGGAAPGGAAPAGDRPGF